MQMTWFEIAQLVIGTGFIGVLLKFAFSLGKVSQKINELSSDILEIKKITSSTDSKLSSIDVRISRIEGYLMAPTVFKDKAQQ